MKSLVGIIIGSILVGVGLARFSLIQAAPLSSIPGVYLVKVYTVEGESLWTDKTSTHISVLDHSTQWRNADGKLRIVRGGIVMVEEQ